MAQRVIKLRGNKNTIENKFLTYSLLSPIFQNLLHEKSTGGTVKGFKGSELHKIPICFPHLKEQKQIADFLTCIDEKIEKLTKKKELFEKYKKGLMQKIFNQEIRFKNENGEDFPEWEEKKIENIFEITRGYVLSMNEVKDKKDDTHYYPVYSSQTKNNGLSGYYNNFLYEDCITWTTDGANAGDVKYRKGKFYCTNVCGVLKSNNGFANSCISEILNSVSKKYVSYVGNPKLMNNVMAKIEIFIPTSIEEQKQIADFLTEIDNKISLVEKQLN